MRRDSSCLRLSWFFLSKCGKMQRICLDGYKRDSCNRINGALPLFGQHMELSLSQESVTAAELLQEEKRVICVISAVLYFLEPWAYYFLTQASLVE